MNDRRTEVRSMNSRKVVQRVLKRESKEEVFYPERYRCGCQRPPLKTNVSGGSLEDGHEIISTR